MLLDVRRTDSALVQTRAPVASYLIVESDPSICSFREFERAENILPGFFKDRCLDGLQDPLCPLLTQMDVIVILKVVIFEVEVMKRDEASASLCGAALHLCAEETRLICFFPIWDDAADRVDDEDILVFLVRLKSLSKHVGLSCCCNF